MKLLVFSIYDSVAKVYSNPFFMPNSGQALRAFGDEVQRSDSVINKHAADYKLYQIGVFDDNSGEFDKDFRIPKFVVNAVDFVPPVK